VECNQEDPLIVVLVGKERPQICIAQGVVHCRGSCQIGFGIAPVRVNPETQVKKKQFLSKKQDKIKPCNSSKGL